MNVRRWSVFVLAPAALAVLAVLAIAGCSKPEEPAAQTGQGDATRLAVPPQKNQQGAPVDPVTGKEDAALTAPGPPPGPPGG